MRITAMNGIDLARFEFDYDNTWQAFFLDSELNVYSRYGGRDEASADGRLSAESLLVTMGEVLEVHERRKMPAAGRPPGSRGRTNAEDRIDGALQPPPGVKTTPADIPLLEAGHQGCVHCHQINEYRHLAAFYDKTFSRQMLFGYPLPENVGISFDRAHGHKIERVIPESPAANAGLVAGDIVTRVGGVPVHSEQDMRWALHRTPDGGQPTVTVLRSGGAPPAARSIRVQLTLAADWRQTELAWRKSLRSVPVPWGLLAYPLGREERRTANLADDGLAIKVVSIRGTGAAGTGLAGNVGLEKGDLIVELDGQRAIRTFDEFKSDLLRRYSPGETVRLTVLRNEKEVKLHGVFPDWHTTDTSVP